MPPRAHTAAKYTGDGSSFYNGIPARDLTEDEYAALSDDDKAVLAASPLYELARAEKAEAKAATPTAAVTVAEAKAESKP